MKSEQLKKFKATGFINIELPKSFIEDFNDIFKSGKFNGILDFFKKEYKGKLLAKDGFDVTDRVLKHWEAVGIIPNNRSTDYKWRKYSYLGYVWVLIAMQLRGFGYGLDYIKSVRDYLSNFQEDTQSEYPLLILFYAYAISGNDTILLLVYDNGTAELALKSEYVVFISETLKVPRHIVINVTSVMKSIDNIFPEKAPVQNPKELDGKEEKIINVFRKKEVTEIIIKKGNSSGQMTYSFNVNPKDKAYFKNLENINHGNVAVSKGDGKVMNVKVTKSEKL